ncbi:hypothetical protein CFY86_19230 [Raoultella ornithinolytica]|uniref:Uncharacterized protein n=1 Tax=Raoultella ornithinolytica TaxID=54291 RepID=A0A855F0T2_RAOOR|nr:hypothetical protein CFY86_19230 [Raoultella ornithinolytica]PJF13332.1 hypothetical protein CU101_15895 [Raoultella ornithinolytica]
MFSKVAILAATCCTLRERCHKPGNGYIRFVNDCDRDRYLDVFFSDVPDARRVN